MRSKYNRWKYWVRLFLVAIFSLLLASLGAVVGVSYQQTIDYLHPTRQFASGEILRAEVIDFQEIELITEENVRLSAWYTPPQNRAVIIVAHGYGNRRAEDFYALFASHGYGVTAWDFRAHGKSEGDFSSLGYYEVLDVKAALDFALAIRRMLNISADGAARWER